MLNSTMVWLLENNFAICFTRLKVLTRFKCCSFKNSLIFKNLQCYGTYTKVPIKMCTNNIKFISKYTGEKITVNSLRLEKIYCVSMANAYTLMKMSYCIIYIYVPTKCKGT